MAKAVSELLVEPFATNSSDETPDVDNALITAKSSAAGPVPNRERGELPPEKLPLALPRSPSLVLVTGTWSTARRRARGFTSTQSEMRDTVSL